MHAESYTTVRVTSYGDSTSISTPNNLYLLWLLYKQELRVSSYNKPSQDYSAAHVHVSPSKRRAQSSDHKYVLRHTGRLTVNRMYIYMALAFQQACAAISSPVGSACEWSDHSRGPEGACRWLPEVGWVLHWPRMAMNLLTQYGLQYTKTVHTPMCTHTSCVARTCRLSVVHWSDSS